MIELNGALLRRVALPVGLLAVGGLAVAACSTPERRRPEDTTWIDARAGDGWGVSITAGANDAGKWHGKFNPAGFGDAISFNLSTTGTAGVDGAFEGSLKLPYGWSSKTEISGSEKSPGHWEGEIDPSGWFNGMSFKMDKQDDGSWKGKISQSGIFDDISVKGFKVSAEGKFKAEFDPAGWFNGININGTVDPANKEIPVGVQVAMMAALQAKKADDKRSDDDKDKEEVPPPKDNAPAAAATAAA